jgi:hypothetical protein
MCCFLASLAFFGPRLAFLIYWLIPFGQLKVAAAFNGWLIPILGLIFLPWTTLIYTLVFPVFGLDWVWLGLALLADLVSYGAGGASRRR